MIKIKKLISFLVTIIIVGVIFINRDVIIDRLDDLFKEKEVVIYPGNGYQKDGDFIKVKQVTTYVPYSYADLVNIFYSILNQDYH